jgi:uncharacterized protein (TIGR03435 family)
MLISAATCSTAVLLAQTPASAPGFEVASIRPASPPTPGAIRSGQFRGSTIDGSHLDFEFVTLYDVLPYAFRIKPYQLVAPSWVREARWNILATLPAGSSPDQAPEMMQRLLAERFKLEFHREKREQPVYELQVVPSGPKVEVSTGGDFKIWDGSFPGFNFSGAGPLQRGGGMISGKILDQPNCGQRWEFVPLSMSTFAYALSLFTGKPVLDETQLKGDYKVILDINADTMYALNQNMFRSLNAPGGGPRGGGGGRGSGPAGPAERGQTPAAPPNDLAACMNDATERSAGTDGNLSMLFQAVQKLGLKLQQGRAPIDTIIVDRLEKTPTEN